MRGALAAGFLFLTQTFFLWTFFASQGLERLADAGVCSGGRDAAYRFAAEWRHGLSDGWPLYVPGFIVSAAAAWFWAFGRGLRRLLPEGTLLLAIAAAVALAAAPAGARMTLEAYAAATGNGCRGPIPPPHAQHIAIGVYTLLAWVIVVLACHRALWRRTYWPLLAPLGADFVLVAVRPFTFDDLVSTWIARAAQGQARAVASLALVPSLAVFLVWRELTWERRYWPHSQRR